MKNLLILFVAILSLSTQSLAQTQTVRGRIIDKQSQFPLVGASVYIPDTAPLVGATTDAEGYFALANVPVGRITLKVSYLGYLEQTIPNVMLTSGKELNLNIALEEHVVSSQEIVITAEKDKTLTNNELTTVSSRGFTIEETTRYAGSRNDPSRMAQNFAGVSGANDSRNDIVIRGNSPTGVLWRLEGIDIPSPNHYGTLGTTGGPVGILNNNVLANSDFMTGAFPAEYGNANAGVFDLQLRSGNKNKREYLAQIGFAGFELGLEGPFSKNSKASYLANYRYSTLAVFSSFGFNFGTGTAVPYYQDLSFKIDVPTAKSGRFSVFGVGGFSNIDLLGSETENPDPQDSYGDVNSDLLFKSAMGVVGFNHLYFFNDKTSSQLSLAISGNYNRGVQDSLLRNFEGDITQKIYHSATNYNQVKYTLREQINKKFNARNTINFGAIAEWTQLNLVDSSLVFGTTNQYRRGWDFKEGTALLQGYFQWQHRFSDKLTLNAGVHYQYFALNSSNAIEPRIGLKYNLSENQSISAGFGKHSQLQPLQIYFRQLEVGDGNFVRTNENLDFTRSNHYVLAYDNSLSSSLRLRVETYYQEIKDAAVESVPTSFSMLNAGADFVIPSKDYLVNGGTGTNYGVELTLEKFYSKGYYFLLTTSVFDSKYKGSDGVERNTAFNGNYVGNFLFGKEFKVRSKNVLFFDTKITVAGGRRFTPIDLEASRMRNYGVEIGNQAFENQFSDYIRWDLKMGYRINRSRLTHEFFVDVQNVLNRENVFSQSYNTLTQNLSQTNQLGLFPVIQYKLTF